MISKDLLKHRPKLLDKVTVEYPDGKRLITCFCGKEVNKTIVPHFRKDHPKIWQKWKIEFVRLRSAGYSWKQIMRLFKSGNGKLLFSWTVVERSIKGEVEAGSIVYTPPSKRSVKYWEPVDFILQETTVWDFPRRGEWAVHSGDFRGNWPPQLPRNLLERYTHRGDLVVDAFVGGGTTLVEAWLLGRRSIGVDISRMARDTANAKLNEMERQAKKDNAFALNPSCRPLVAKGSALNLADILKENKVHGEVKLLCAHPPYMNSLKYTDDSENDLSLIKEPQIFYDKMRLFAREAAKVLAGGNMCALLIGDIKCQGKLVPLGLRTLDIFLGEKFEVDSIVLKTQHKDRSSEFYNGKGKHYLLLSHEYLFILLRK